ncbi:unnamed protein product [Mytilus coruscus]|uniref:Uncharacterized protein n=1 Tax=Mytilus coruscus TaxID=42192 RepID=A0A6J8DWA0_MYTCO|nr:unnamed protein product [Mytilus coruscus]
MLGESTYPSQIQSSNLQQMIKNNCTEKLVGVPIPVGDRTRLQASKCKYSWVDMVDILNLAVTSPGTKGETIPKLISSQIETPSKSYADTGKSYADTGKSYANTVKSNVINNDTTIINESEANVSQIDNPEINIEEISDNETENKEIVDNTPSILNKERKNISSHQGQTTEEQCAGLSSI